MSIDRKTSLLRDRSARRAVKRAYRMCVTRSSSLRITCGSISSSRCQTTCAAAIFRSPRCEFGFHGQVPTGVSNFDPRSTRIWWSQTGSNRRPPACKAGALPTELWPQRHAKQRTRGGTYSSSQALRFQSTWQMWWAWEDLNFRPHAYQARALTS